MSMKLQKIENYSHFLATSMKMSLIFVWGHHVLGDISFVLERMKFTTEERSEERRVGKECRP